LTTVSSMLPGAALERCQCCHWACAGSFKTDLTSTWVGAVVRAVLEGVGAYCGPLLTLTLTLTLALTLTLTLTSSPRRRPRRLT